MEALLKVALIALTVHAVLLATLPVGAPLWECALLIALSLLLSKIEKNCIPLALLYLGYFGPRLVEALPQLYKALISADLALMMPLLHALGIRVVDVNILALGDAAMRYTIACSSLRALAFVVPALPLARRSRDLLKVVVVSFLLVVPLNALRVGVIMHAASLIGPELAHVFVGTVGALITGLPLMIVIDKLLPGYLDYLIGGIECVLKIHMKN